SLLPGYAARDKCGEPGHWPGPYTISWSSLATSARQRDLLATGRLALKTLAARGIEAGEDVAVVVVERELRTGAVPRADAIKRGWAAQWTCAETLAETRLRRGDTAALAGYARVPDTGNAAGADIRAALRLGRKRGDLSALWLAFGAWSCRELRWIGCAGL